LRKSRVARKARAARRKRFRSIVSISRFIVLLFF
jgi:hypothetical protein